MIVNGTAVPNARFFAPTPSVSATLDYQAFHRPIINDKGQIVFIGTWITDSGMFGRGIFLSRSVGSPLECVAATGQLTRETIEDAFGQPIDIAIGAQIGRVPSRHPNSFEAQNDFASLEQVSFSDCGVIAFTADLVREQDGGFFGWGLFVLNTADPRPGLGQPAYGPRLVVKSGLDGTTPEWETGDSEFPAPVIVSGHDNTFFHSGIAFGHGETEGGDATVHPDGTVVFAVNPDQAGGPVFLFQARQPSIELDFDGDQVVDGCDACPTTITCGGSGGDCENCLLCIEIDCPFGGLLLGLGPDFDQSGVVDDTDINLMMMAMGVKGGRFDVNKDGFVNNDDLSLLVAEYGKTVTKK